MMSRPSFVVTCEAVTQGFGVAIVAIVAMFVSRKSPPAGLWSDPDRRE